jgi:hypothetical protein
MEVAQTGSRLFQLAKMLARKQRVLTRLAKADALFVHGGVLRINLLRRLKTLQRKQVLL